jgi:hypothetical protein
MRHLGSRLLLVLCAALAACGGGDPAAEQPVNVKPGLYRLSLDRPGFGPAKVGLNSKNVEEQCLAGETDLEWIYPMVERKFCPECACSTEDKTRTGNSIGARAVCPIDDSGMFGALEYAWRGVVAEEGVTLEGKVKSGLASFVPPEASEAEKQAARAKADSEATALSGRIERVGDCPA